MHRFLIMWQWLWDAGPSGESRFRHYQIEVQRELQEAWERDGNEMSHTICIRGHELIVRKSPKKGWIQQRADDESLWRVRGCACAPHADASPHATNFDWKRSCRAQAVSHRKHTHASASTLTVHIDNDDDSARLRLPH